MFNEVGVPFVDIGGFFYHHCLNFLFMINLHTALQLPNDTLMNFYRCLSPGLEQAQQCGRVKLVNGMDGYYWALHHIYWPLIIQNDVYSIYYSQACPCGHLY
jgi:hypothetical protein